MAWTSARWSRELVFLAVVLSPGIANASEDAAGDWDLSPPRVEPKYENSPCYALLVFGEKRERRVWMVLDGTTLFVDRDADGDLTEPGERLRPSNPTDGSNRFGGSGSHTHFDVFDFEIETSVDSGGEVQRDRFVLHHWVRAEKFEPQTDFDRRIFAEREKSGYENSTLWRKEGLGQGQTPLLFMPQAQDAQVCALDGVLSFAVKGAQSPALKRGSTSCDVAFHIVVPGRPPVGLDHEFHNALATSEVPEGAYLDITIDYPTEAAKPPVQRIHLLKDRC